MNREKISQLSVSFAKAGYPFVIYSRDEVGSRLLAKITEGPGPRFSAKALAGTDGNVFSYCGAAGQCQYIAFANERLRTEALYFIGQEGNDHLIQGKIPGAGCNFVQ